MSNFDFKKVLKENLYNFNYSGDDKVRVVLNEGKTLLVEREIHEGIMDLLKGFTRTQPGWEKELERQIDAWLEKSALEDARKLALKRFYMRNLESLPPSFYEDEENLEQVEDSLNAAEEGDVDKAEQELEDAVESAEGEESEAKKGESLKAKKGDLVVVTSGDNQFLLRIGDIVGGEEEEPESRRGSLGQRARRRSTGRFGGGSMRLGSRYSESLRESILRLNEQEYMIDAGISSKNGVIYRPEKAVNLTVDIARIATDEDIAKVKEEFPEQFERAFVSQEEPSAAKKPSDQGGAEEDTATELVDKNASKLIAALLDDTKLTSTVRNQLRNYLNSFEGIKIAKSDSVDPFIDLIRTVIANPRIRGQVARIAKAEEESGNKNESKKYLKKVIKESIKAYVKHENRKQLKS